MKGENLKSQSSLNRVLNSYLNQVLNSQEKGGDMTKEEVLEKYGDVPLRFSSYYKYSFRFSGLAEDGVKIFASIGGNADDIYRWEITPDKVITLNDDDPSYFSLSDGGTELYCWIDEGDYPVTTRK